MTKSELLKELRKFPVSEWWLEKIVNKVMELIEKEKDNGHNS